MEHLEGHGDRIRARFYHKIVREVVLWGLAVCSLCNAIIMVLLFAAGVHKAIRASLIYFSVLTAPREFNSPEAAMLSMVLRSVELLLLAPLGYLVTSALAVFIMTLVEEGETQWVPALRELVAVKSLSISILLSIIAVDFVNKVLTREPLEVTDAAIEGTFFLLFIGYLFVLEINHRKHD